jgi:hypothetical protein
MGTAGSRDDHVHQLGDHDHASSGGEGGPIDYADLTGTPGAPVQYHAELAVDGSGPPPAPFTTPDGTDYLYVIVFD